MNSACNFMWTLRNCMSHQPLDRSVKLGCMKCVHKRGNKMGVEQTEHLNMFCLYWNYQYQTLTQTCLNSFNVYISSCVSHVRSGRQHPKITVPSLVSQKPRPRGRSASAAGRVSFGRKEHVCRSPLHGREFAQAVHAAGWSGTAGAHVHDPAALWHQFLLCEYWRRLSLIDRDRH